MLNFKSPDSAQLMNHLVILKLKAIEYIDNIDQFFYFSRYRVSEPRNARPECLDEMQLCQEGKPTGNTISVSGLSHPHSHMTAIKCIIFSLNINVIINHENTLGQWAQFNLYFCNLSKSKQQSDIQLIFSFQIDSIKWYKDGREFYRLHPGVASGYIRQFEVRLVRVD